MVELFELIAGLIQRLVEAIGYPGIFFAALLEAVFPPLPSEFVMPFSGFQVARGDLSFLGAVTASTLGSVAGAVVMYYVGVWAEERVIRRFLRRYGRFFSTSEADLDRALNVFERHGEIVVFAARLIPLVRTLISIPAGMSGMSLSKFILFTLAGTAIWSAALTYAGVVLGENWQDVLTVLRSYQGLLLAGGVAVCIVVVVWFALRRTRRSE